MSSVQFVEIAHHLEDAGLLWKPEIGDEIFNRKGAENVSVLVDTGGLTPPELRDTYIWLPTVEQMVIQIEVRQAILFHAGLELNDHTYCYKTVLQAPQGPIESEALSFRESLGLALRDLLLFRDNELH